MWGSSSGATNEFLQSIIIAISYITIALETVFLIIIMLKKKV